MIVVTPAGDTIDLGTVEATPTIGIIDYSRRVTDDFGVTTVVPRGFARRMSVRLAVPSGDVDALQRTLADLRAVAATWIADARFQSLTVRGFFKDFSIDIANGSISYCTLTVEGLTVTEPITDTGADPSPEGKASTLRLLDPIVMTDAALVSASVPESDHPEWAVGTGYGKGARVIKAATHRVYESAADGNAGNDPAGDSGKWLDVGPTNRWAAFDQALGTATTSSDQVIYTIDGPIGAVALLDVSADAVRVTADGYDRTQPAGPGAVTFLDLPAGTTRVTVALTGGLVAVGTLLVGQIAGLGITEASPTAGITDYSRKVTDDFGDVTVVERAWAKRMAARALLRTEAVDDVVTRLTTVRARPVLWLGREGQDSLTVYGFFKDFSIEAGQTVSKLSLTVEGLSKAAPAPLPIGGGSVAWPDITDPLGTKPDDNADVTGENTAKDTAAVGGRPAGEITGRLDTLVTVTIPAVEAAGAAASQRITEARAAADLALDTIESEVERVDQRIDNISASGGYDDTALKAEVRRVDEVSLGRDAALGQRIDSVSASITTTDSDLRALVQTVDTAAVDRDNAIGQRIDTLIAEGGGGSDGVDTVARAEIRRVEQAAVLGQQALATRTSTLETQASPSGGNLVPNSTLSTLDGWGLTNSPDGQTTLLLNASGPAVMIGGVENALSLVRGPAGRGLCSEVQCLPFAVRAGSSVQAYALTVATRCRAWVSIYFLDGDGRFVDYGGEHFGERVSAGGQDMAAWDITGVQEAIVPSGAVRAAIVLRAYDVDGNGIAYFSRPFMTEVKPGTKTWAPYSAGNDRAITSAANARIKTTETTLADLPNRYATAQRASNIEASVGAVGGRVSAVETVTSNGTFATASRAEQIASYAGGIEAKVDLQAGTIAGLGQKTAAYVRVIADAGNGRAALSLWSDQYGGAWSLTGDGLIDGNLTVNGTITAKKFDRFSMSREGFATWSGSITPAGGQTLTVPWSLALTQIPALGRFIYEYTVSVSTNAGQSYTETINGRPAFTTYIDDGGLTVVAVDGQGNRYEPVANSSKAVLATTDFVPTWNATIRAGNSDTGYVDKGDSYRRAISATYTVTSISLKVTWVAI